MQQQQEDLKAAGNQKQEYINVCEENFIGSGRDWYAACYIRLIAINRKG
jgi:hypothetical protein